MKTHLTRCFAVSLAMVATAFGAVEPPVFTARELAQGYREHRILAKPKTEFREAAEQVEAREGLRLRRKFSHLRNLRVLELDAADSVDRAIARLRATGRYDYVEPDHLLYARATPNDPSFSQQWSLRNTGQSGGTFGADIGAVTAWNTLSSATSVIVAVVDSGMRLTHQDLSGNLWTSSTGTHGINAILSPGSFGYTNPADDAGHGTHVAGIVGAAGNNGIGISGVAWSVKLMPLKFIDTSGTGSTSDAVECINFAIANGAHIINASYGGVGNSSAHFEAVKAARDAGIIFVAAAGNESLNNDVVADYPSGFALDNIVAVASTTRVDALATSSSYGNGSVELGAPGDQIYSTYYGSDSDYQIRGGTSMATPHVAGALALLKARFPSDNYRQIINRLLRSTTKLSALDGKVQTGGRLNLAQALASTTNRPFNDDFTARATLSGPSVRVRSSNVGATAEPGEPAHAGVAGATSLWWSWTAAESTLVAFETTGSAYDTVLAVYTGSALGSLQLLGANDDINDSSNMSRVVLNAAEGTTYHIAVAGKNSAEGYTALKVGAVPAHDNFADAKMLSGLSVKETSTTLNASRESGEPSPANVGAGRSVWYTWTAPSSGTCSLAVFATSMDTVSAVYTGASVSSLTTIASNNNNAESTNTDALVYFYATAGVTYYFQVDHFTSFPPPERGDFTLTLTDSLWEFPTHGEVTSSPAVANDGTIYFGAGSEAGFDTGVYAVTSGGTQKWRFATGDEGVIGGSPAIGADGTVYIGSMDYSLYALNGSTGAKKWSYASDSPIYSTPAIGSDGTIYFRNKTKLYALTAAGALKWPPYTLNAIAADGTGGTYSSPVIAADGTIYVGTTDGKFYALTDQGASVALKWSYTADDGDPITDDDIYTTAAIGADGTIYFGTLAGWFYALTPGTSGATQKWSIPLPLFQGARPSISSSPSLAPDGTIYFAAYDHKLYALNPQNGSTKWTYLLGDEVRASSPAVDAAGTVYVGCYDGLVYAVRSNGALLRTYPSAGWIRSSPVIAGNRLYFGSNDAKLHAFDIGQSAAASPWPMFQHDALRTGRAISGVSFTTQPLSQTANIGGSVTLMASAIGASAYRWQFNGTDIAGATTSSLALTDVQLANTGVYTVIAANGSVNATSDPAIVGVLTTTKVIGFGRELIPANLTHPNGNIFDQVLLEGTAAAITADYAENQITRMSYIDVDNDIVQIQFSGPGTLSLVLDSPTGPAGPVNYNQDVNYMKGHAGIVISGADEHTNVMVFSVGRVTAVNQTLFKSDVAYDGIADIAFIAITSTNGKFGGVRTANTNYFALKGLTGIYAPGVAFQGPVYLGNVSAFADATPVIVLGSASDARITGGDLLQNDNQPVQVSGITQLQFTAGTDSHGNPIAAQANRAVLRQNGVDVTAQIVVNPAP